MIRRWLARLLRRPQPHPPRSPWDASRKLTNLERVLLVLALPVAIVVWPVAWLWERIRRGQRRRPGD